MRKPVDRGAFSIAEVGQRLGVGRRIVRMMMCDGRLKAFNMNAGVMRKRPDGSTAQAAPRWRITKESVERLVEG